ncbi:hypothetical protein [Kordia zhangzhouensis]|uniref:hypothetical protein n=1 Tax=Kordia zhangzhouensis TaxID=1620405 RepID=UPI0006293584|nr:hypothetical protein [Kordia zhangzhouensis]
MYAYDYGLKNYNKKYQPLPNLVIFNDEIIIEDDSEKNPEEQIIDETKILGNPNHEPSFSEYAYFEVEKRYEGNFKLLDGKIGLDISIAEEYMIPNGYLKDLGNNNTIQDYNDNGFQVYEYKNRYFAKIVTLEFLQFAYPGYTAVNAMKLYKQSNLEQVTIVTKPSRKNKLKRKIFALSDVFLRELKDNPEVSVIFFFSNDGAKIDNTHITIDNIRDNEIVFFLEKNDSYNIFGTVARVLSGANIKAAGAFPTKAIAKMARLLNVDTDETQIEDIAIEHIKKKEESKERGILYFLGKAVDAVVSVGTWLIKASFGDGLIAIGEGITSLKFGDHRWKYYDKEGNPNPKFNPIFPGLKSLIDSLQISKEEAEQQEASFKETKEKILEGYNNFMDYIPHKRLRDYLKKKLSFIPKMLIKLSELYTKFVNFIKEGIASTLIYLNALFIGVINSLLDAIGGIFSLVGMILSLPYYLHQAATDEKRGSYVSLVFELLENGIEGFVKLFSLENLGAVVNFAIKAADLSKSTFSKPETVVTQLQKGASFVKTHMDNIGYVVGYIIGFIIEEVLYALFTLGTGNILQAFRVTADSMKKLLTAPKRVLKFSINNTKDFIKALVAMFDQIKKFDLKKALDTLLEWIQKLASTTKKLAQKAFEDLFPNKSTRDKITKAGFEPTKVNAAGDTITFCPIK